MGKLHYFLEIQVTKMNDGGLMLSQGKYVQDLLAKVGMKNCKPCITPLPSTLKIHAVGGEEFDDPSLGTTDYGLKIHKDPSLKITAYCDSYWAGDPNEKKSVGGFCVFLGRNLVSWQSKKQGVVARSSTEAEYRSLADLVAELIWIKGLIGELKWPVQELPMAYCDNQSVVLLAANPILH
ncbi:uncharacterized mitochondrial protein AtMg00810-like [Arachis duranensis]|uniref:Uncharacterized mitochondrial protein AtMg00810-like n=1 Tax=Arachis duranensis TaxID=130453 RepID=A0A6P5NAK3_ARADU|nr:uncharacterized mitochondrial protein AtMg00810-like [Arachis duranensis]